MRVREHPKKGPYVENLTVSAVNQYSGVLLRPCTPPEHRNT